jgi:hypothetical protein
METTEKQRCSNKLQIPLHIHSFSKIEKSRLFSELIEYAQQIWIGFAISDFFKRSIQLF